MPVQRTQPVPILSLIPVPPTEPMTMADGAEGGDPDGDGEDNRTYCFCERVSYGEMIACDDTQCEREWVSPHVLLAYIKFFIDFPYSSSILHV